MRNFFSSIILTLCSILLNYNTLVKATTPVVNGSPSTTTPPVTYTTEQQNYSTGCLYFPPITGNSFMPVVRASNSNTSSSQLCTIGEAYHEDHCSSWDNYFSILWSNNTHYIDGLSINNLQIDINSIFTFINTSLGDCFNGLYAMQTAKTVEKANPYSYNSCHISNNSKISTCINDTNPYDRFTIENTMYAKNPYQAMLRMLENTVAEMCSGEGKLNSNPKVLYFFTNIKCQNLLTYSNDPAIDVIRHVLEGRAMNNMQYSMLYIYVGDSKDDLNCLRRVFNDIINYPVYDKRFNYTQFNSDWNPVDMGNTYMSCSGSRTKEGSNKVVIIIVSTLSTVGFILGLVLIGFCVYYRKKKREAERTQIALRILTDHKKEEERYKMHLRKAEDRAFDDEWEVEVENLTIYEIVGSGAFGAVHRGALKGRIPLLEMNPSIKLYLEGMNEENLIVAIKKMPSHTDDSAAQELVEEIVFMKNLGFHVHVLSLLGCVSSRIEPMLILEYCENGDLLKFIKTSKQNGNMEAIEPKRLLSFGWQVADGMLYLSSKNLIHRDLAARNVLLTKSLTAKISDFGLCRSVNAELYVSSNGGRLPIKWMSLEAIKKFTFSNKSDAWAYGVVLWELFTHGDLPYPAVQTNDLIEFLEQGRRLAKPEIASPQIYEIMMSCWEYEPEARPDFVKLREEMSTLLDQTNTYGYLAFDEN